MSLTTSVSATVYNNLPRQSTTLRNTRQKSTWMNKEMTLFAPEEFFWGAKLVSTIDTYISCITGLELLSIERNKTPMPQDSSSAINELNCSCHTIHISVILLTKLSRSVWVES